jgi:hypothetical protein
MSDTPTFSLSAPVPNEVSATLEAQVKELFAAVQKAREAEKGVHTYEAACEEVTEQARKLEKLAKGYGVVLDASFTDYDFGRREDYDDYESDMVRGARVAGTWLHSSMRC